MARFKVGDVVKLVNINYSFGHITVLRKNPTYSFKIGMLFEIITISGGGKGKRVRYKCRNDNIDSITLFNQEIEKASRNETIMFKL